MMQVRNNYDIVWEKQGGRRAGNRRVQRRRRRDHPHFSAAGVHGDPL
ncbi:MAG: hypothetical protein ACLR4Z_02395 [Butyricicoccaceae bacterium]